MKADTTSLTPGTLIDGARMFAAAADAVNERHPNALHVLSHLLGMSIELALKAHLRLADLSVSELRKLGHDLGALLAAAEKAGLVSTGSRHFRINVLGANYDERLFAYPAEGVTTIILPARLREIAQGLIEEVFIAVHGKDRFAEMQHEPGLGIQSQYPDDLDASAWAAFHRAPTP
jgi:hypothetical protein